MKGMIAIGVILNSQNGVIQRLTQVSLLSYASFKVSKDIQFWAKVCEILTPLHPIPHYSLFIIVVTYLNRVDLKRSSSFVNSLAKCHFN